MIPGPQAPRATTVTATTRHPSIRDRICSRNQSTRIRSASTPTRPSILHSTLLTPIRARPHTLAVTLVCPPPVFYTLYQSSVQDRASMRVMGSTSGCRPMPVSRPLCGCRPQAPHHQRLRSSRVTVPSLHIPCKARCTATRSSQPIIPISTLPARQPPAYSATFFTRTSSAQAATRPRALPAHLCLARPEYEMY